MPSLPLLARVATATATCAVAATASASSTFTLPDGFALESIPGPGPVVAQLLDGTILSSTGTFGADELSIRNADGTHTLFADGFGSLAGVAQSPVTGDIVVGDSLDATALWILSDLNADGDALDAGEKTPHPVQPPVLPNGSAPLPFGLAFRPGTDELFMTGSTPFGVEPLLGVVTRTVDGAVAVYADGLGFAGGLVVDAAAIHLADLAADFSAGRIVRLEDLNADGDALDAGEAVDFAPGLSGASDLVRASDGSLYVSGQTDLLGDFSGCVDRILPDGDGDGVTDGVVPCVFDGWRFAGGLALVEQDGFAAGTPGGGTLYVEDFAFQGDRAVHAAPFCQTAVDGAPASLSNVFVTVSGDPSAEAFFAISFDTEPVTVGGIGDLCFGFSDLFAISGTKPVGPSGEVTSKVVFREFPGLVGLPLVIQGFTLQDGSFGIGNALDFVFGS